MNENTKLKGQGYPSIDKIHEKEVISNELC